MSTYFVWILGKLYIFYLCIIRKAYVAGLEIIYINWFFVSEISKILMHTDNLSLYLHTKDAQSHKILNFQCS